MGEYNFSRRECIRALEKIGFEKKTKRRGKHIKFTAPKPYNQLNKFGQPPFIMIPKNRKLKIQDAIIIELRKLGGNDLVEEFKQNL